FSGHIRTSFGAWTTILIDEATRTAPRTRAAASSSGSIFEAKESNMAARVLIPILIVLLVAQSIEAQQAVNEGTRPLNYRQVFLDGALIGDDYSRPGVGLAAGVDLPRRLAVHVEAEIPTTWYSVRDVGRGSAAALELNYSTRTSAYAVLLGRRFGANPRIHLEVLGGFAALFDSYKAKGYFDNLAPDGSAVTHNPYDNHGTEHFLGLT